MNRDNTYYCHHIFIFLIFLGTPLSAQIEFRRLDTPRGEIMYTIACDSSGVLYASTKGRGIVRSTNSGDSWEKTSLTYGTLWPINATASGKVYAFEYKSPTTVHVSEDHGQNWEIVADSITKYLGSTVVRFHNGVMYSEGRGGLHRSTDDGETWTTIRDLPPRGTRYWPDYQLEIISDSIMIAYNYPHVYRSDDGGESWTILDLGGMNAHRLIRDPAGRVCLLGQDENDEYPGEVIVRLSEDATSWETIGPTPVSGSRSRYYPLPNGNFLVGSSNDGRYGILLSPDSGKTWLQTNVADGAVNGFCTTPDGTVFAAAHSGIYRSYDDGRSWEECNSGLTARRICHLFTVPDGQLFAGTFSGGLYRSINDGNSWQYIYGTGKRIKEGFNTDANDLLLGTVYRHPMDTYGISGPVHSDRLSLGTLILDHFSEIDSSWSTVDESRYAPRTIVKGLGGTVYGNGNGWNISTDGGRNWSGNSLLARAWLVQSNSKGIYAFISDSKNNSLFYREHGDEIWQMIRLGKIQSLGTTTESVIVVHEKQVETSSNNGNSWLQSVLSDYIYGAKVITLGNRKNMICSMDRWFELSLDNGQSWDRIVPDHISRQTINTGTLDSRGRLVVGGKGGLLRSVKPLTQSALEFHFTLEPPYPNPSADFISIPIMLEEAGVVHLTIHDLTGRVLRTVYHGNLLKGRYTMWLNRLLDPVTLKGLLFCSLSVNGKVQTQPIVFSP